MYEERETEDSPELHGAENLNRTLRERDREKERTGHRLLAAYAPGGVAGEGGRISRTWHVITWRPVQSVPHLSHHVSWDWLKVPYDHEWIKRSRLWMDG